MDKNSNHYKQLVTIYFVTVTYVTNKSSLMYDKWRKSRHSLESETKNSRHYEHITRDACLPRYT